MTKFVVTSDVHLHAWKQFGGSSGKDNVRLQRTLEVLHAALQRAREEEAVWLDGGDLCHTTGYCSYHISSAAISLLQEFPDVCKILIPGNHDARKKGGFVEVEESFQYIIQEAVDNVTVLNGDKIDVNGVSIYGVAAQPTPEYIEFEPADIGIFHEMVKGSKLPNGTVLSEGLDKNTLLENYRLSICGDVHHPHVHEEDDRYILVPGSPEHHNFGDHGERGFWVVDIGDSVELDFVPSESPKFITVETPEEVEEDGNYYRVLGGDPRKIPDHATVVTAEPTTVETRNVFTAKDSVDDVLSKWLELEPPEHDGEYLSIGKKLVEDQDILVPEEHILLSVEGKNFGPYREFKYDIDNGVTLILGETDTYDSNSAGKSTLMEAPYWCLTGKTTKGQSGADVVRRGCKKCHVKTTYKLSDGRTMEVLRERKPQLSMTVKIDGEELSADTNKDLQGRVWEILSLNEKILQSLQYFSQEQVTLLSRASDAEIKEVIADIAGLSGYQDAASSANSKAKEKEEEYNKTQALWESKKEQKDSEGASLADIQKKIKEFSDNQKERIESLNKEEAEYTRLLGYWQDQQKNRLPNLLSRVEELKSRMESTADSIREETYARLYEEIKKKASKELEEKQEKLKEYPDSGTEEIEKEINELEENQDKLEEKFNKVRTKLSKLQNQYDNLQREVKKLESKKSKIEGQGVCPECGQELADNSKLEEIEKELSEKKEELSALDVRIEKGKEYDTKALEALSQTKDKLKNKRDELSKLHKRDNLNLEIQNLESQIEHHAEKKASEKAENAASAYKSWRSEQLNKRLECESYVLGKIEHYAQKKTAVEETLNDIQNQENPHQEYEDKTKEKIKSLDKEIKNLNKNLEKVEEEQNIYEYWAKAFGKGGIQSLLMDEIAGEFNNIRSHIIPTLTNGVLDVQFATQSTTKSGEVREKLEFVCFENGTEIPYTDLSGGQRRRIDVGVLLTLVASVSRSYGIQGLLGVLFLDEILDNLDRSGVESVATTLKEYSEKFVPAIYIVSHDDDLKSLFDQYLLVRKENGVSEIMN